MAFCSKHGQGDCHMGDDKAWDKNLGKFYVISANGTVKQTKSQQMQTLKPNEIWRIVPPIENGDPYWCMDQPCRKDDPCDNPSTRQECIKRRQICIDNDGWIRNCPGVGAWFTSADKDKITGSVGSRIEYNVNNGEIWFNSSAVDATNSNFSANYTKCSEKKRKCITDLTTCKHVGEEQGVKVCLAPKFWPDKDINECGTSGFGKQFNMSPRDLAAAAFGDPNKKIEYHKWWGTNKCALDWLKWLQKNPKCDMYGWAYDEMRWKPGDSFDKNGNPPENKEVNPLIHCKLDKGNLNIDVLKVMK